MKDFTYVPMYLFENRLFAKLQIFRILENQKTGQGRIKKP